MAPRGRRLRRTAALLGACVALAAAGARAQEAAPRPTAIEAPAAPPPPVRTFEVSEYRVEGASTLSALEVEAALAPFLGPGRVLEDVERARQALEKAYSDRGYQSVVVAIPQQTVRDGVVRLTVTEARVGRLRVRGARYFSLREIERLAPSVAEDVVPNYDALVQDMLALNQLPDRRVTPALRAGVIPGTLDVDLNVKDTLPLHGSLEVNDRHSANTTDHRLNGALRYDNLWQAGHSLALSAQVAPERLDDSQVYSASYTARFADVPWLSLTATGVLQDSDISTLGGIGVKGRGHVVGVRASFTLPSGKDLFHTVSLGVDYKRFQQALTLGEDDLSTPITYWPVTAQYGAMWLRERSQTQLSLAVVSNLRPLSSSRASFDAKGYRASPSFIYYRGELSRSDELPLGLQLFEKVAGQYSAGALTQGWTRGLPPPDPGLPDVGGPFGEKLLDSEQLTAGGADSVRGYHEAQAAGDYGAVGTIELRGPSLATWWQRRWVNEARLIAFADGAWLGIHHALPDQEVHPALLGVGGGARLEIQRHLGGAVDVAVPLRSQGETKEYHPRLHLRAWFEF